MNKRESTFDIHNEESGERILEKEKKVIESHACWMYYTFDEAVKDADKIIYGKVLNIGNTLCDEDVLSDGSVSREYYTEVTIEVLDAIKGIDDNVYSATYLESGGETEDAIYNISGVPKVSIGEEYVFF